jgi:hypothetical protein
MASSRSLLHMLARLVKEAHLKKVSLDSDSTNMVLSTLVIFIYKFLSYVNGVCLDNDCKYVDRL